MASNKSKTTVLITLIIIIILAVVGYFIFRPKPQVLTLSSPVKIDTTGQPTIGNANAPVQIVAFEDLKCVNCKHFNNQLYPKIKKKYIDTGIARYTFINLAFIPGSLPAANAARCLYKQNKSYYFPFVEYIYHHQPGEEVDWATISKLLQFAKAAAPKADLNQLSTCIITGKYNDFMQNNLKMATKIMQGQVATPAIYIGGRKLESLSMDQVDTLVTAAKDQPLQ